MWFRVCLKVCVLLRFSSNTNFYYAFILLSPSEQAEACFFFFLFVRYLASKLKMYEYQAMCSHIFGSFDVIVFVYTQYENRMQLFSTMQCHATITSGKCNPLMQRYELPVTSQNCTQSKEKQKTTHMHIVAYFHEVK